MDRSLRQLGQLLVVMRALLGAITGVALALIMDNAASNRAAAAPGREHTAVLAAHPPSSQPPATRAASSQEPAEGNATSGNRRAESADRADQHTGKAPQERPEPPGQGGQPRQGQT